MKKEFKAPIIEIKALFTQNSVMAEDLAIFANSDGPARNGYKLEDDTVSGFNAWKGFGSN